MILDWIFEGIVNWVSSIVTKLMDAVSGLFLGALGTNMTAMEEYFPFVARAFTIMQYTAWVILFLITVWQLFRAFGGNLNESESPGPLVLRSALFAFLIYYAKPIFLYILKIATAPYTALMDVTMGSEHFTFAGIENVVKNGLTNFISDMSVVGAILVTILMIALGWNYFKLLLEVVERYVVVGVLCYTSPLAYSMGASKTTSQVFKSWCRMVGSQLLMLIMNVWFLRAFSSSVGQFIGSGGALTTGKGSIFLWLFCAIAFLKVAQRFDTYLATIGLNAAKTGAGIGMEMLVAARVLTGFGGGGLRSAGSVFRGVPSGGAGGGGFFAGFANRFRGNSYVRDSVVQGGTRMGMGGPMGFVGRAVGGLAARNGASLTGNSISSVAGKMPNVSGTISGDIADRSLPNYMPHLAGKNLAGTEISGGRITTNMLGADGKSAGLSFYNSDQYEEPTGPHSVVSATDGSKWYQTASGEGAANAFDMPSFDGTEGGATLSNAFPGIQDGTLLRTVDNGIMEATTADGNSLWYSSAVFDEPTAPHSVVQASDGMEWYAMQPNAGAPAFETGDDAAAYNQATFQNFMPGYAQPISNADGTYASDGRFEVRHEDGSGTMFYDATRYSAPHGAYETYSDVSGNSWYAVHGSPSVERIPVYENGAPVYDGDNVRTVQRETVRYGSSPSRYGEPKARTGETHKPNRKK